MKKKIMKQTKKSAQKYKYKLKKKNKKTTTTMKEPKYNKKHLEVQTKQ